MANTNLSISIALGVEGYRPADFTIGTNAPASGDFEFRVNAVSNGKTVTRRDMIRALDAIRRVIESNGVFTTDLAQ